MPEKYLKWLVFAFAFLLYANTLDLKYTLDDSLMITGNKFTQKGMAASGTFLPTMLLWVFWARIICCPAVATGRCRR